MQVLSLERMNERALEDQQSYNPIEHIKKRIKTPESIVKKLKSRMSSIENGAKMTLEAD